jgi:hypothetical protein
MREQWTKGFQWGGVAWLACVAASSVLQVVRYSVEGVYPPFLLMAAGWTFALALTWTRWSRVGVAAGILLQVYVGAILEAPIVQREDYMFRGVMTESFLNLEPLLSSFLPRCLPLLPLLFMAPAKPRYAVALALVGRWRDAVRELAGVRWMLVAAGIVALPFAAPEALQWWGINEDGRVDFQWASVARALAPCAVLFGLAAIRPRTGRPVRSTA